MPQETQHNLVRPPVVVVMGHIDHGKSTLLDYIRKANVVEGEAGGITQHVGAYQAEYTDAKGTKHLFTFLDTPGHAAFCSIRERGALAADIAILVVSAEDGVKPQTVEALKEIKTAGIPYIVAINKIDKPNADIDRTKTSLGEHEIYVEGWGGDIPCVAISALTGAGIPELLDMINLIAELSNLKATKNATAEGIVLESEVDTRKGIAATILIKNGTLKTGSFVVAGKAFSPVRYIENWNGTKIEEAGPSVPVVIFGWNEVPACGTVFTTVATKKEAEKVATAAPIPGKTKNAQGGAGAMGKNSKPVTSTSPTAQPENVVTIPFIIKADAIGSLDGVKLELSKIKSDKVVLKCVSDGLGEINENDVKVAIGDPSVIILGFNEAPDTKAAAIAERSPVPLTIRTFKVIYDLVEYVKSVVVEKTPKEYVDEVTGRAKILAVFSKEKDKQVVGGKVQEGLLETGSVVRIMRRETEVGTGTIRELQQQKKRTSEVREGYEFGTLIEAKVEIAAGDKVEAVRRVEKK